jgi:hypothetical protein
VGARGITSQLNPGKNGVAKGACCLRMLQSHLFYALTSKVNAEQLGPHTQTALTAVYFP